MSLRPLLTLAIAATTAHVAAAYLFRRQRERYAGDRRHFLVVQGGSQLRPSGDDISDAVVSVMMGGLLLDLRDTELTRRPSRLDILAVMGGVALVMPPSWRVQIDVHPTMGGVRDGRSASIDPERPPDIVVSGRVVMGGLDIASELPRRMRAVAARSAAQTA